MAGASAKVNAELRLAGFKGALRFWWRAMGWQRFADLDQVRSEGARIFGDATAQSAVLFRLGAGLSQSCSGGDCLPIEVEDETSGEGLLYLGAGLWETVDTGKSGGRRGARPTELRVSRACLPAPFEFTVKMLVRGADGQDVICQELEQSLKLLGLVGGIGARSRRGFGSLTLVELRAPAGRVWKAPQTLEALASELEALKLFGASGSASNRVPYTAFSKDSRVVLLQGGDNESAAQLLDRVGKEMMRYRSWGKKGVVLGQRAEKNFRDDHHLMQSATQGRRVNGHPKRIVFGLPQSYYFSSLRTGSSVTPSGLDVDRRASPLLIHIHQVSDERPVAVVTFLPADFLPDGEEVSVGKKSRVEVKTNETLWEPIHGFLDRLLDASRSVESFDVARELRA
ncbi:MAG: type III-B CRISPR module RAMP protein Cmr1 [Bradymonadaceae bacterium]|nr:type III-B CRISPR module RAMP protein Cmr1 [Lujinxingiaceae bacterium]